MYVSLTSFDLQYGNQNICWIGNVDAVLLTFVLPTGTSTFFNVVCLGVSLHGLEIAKRNSKYLQKTKKDKQRWLMFLQMFIMCGGSWVLAYAASNVPFELLKVTNIVLNGCQGIYILIITTKDSKVKRWLAVQMKRLRTRSTTSSGPQTNSTDNVNNIKNTKLWITHDTFTVVHTCIYFYSYDFNCVTLDVLLNLWRNNLFCKLHKKSLFDRYKTCSV